LEGDGLKRKKAKDLLQRLSFGKSLLTNELIRYPR